MPNPSPQLTGVVLGGGLSRRLGGQKSKLLIHIGGKLVLARVADTLRQICSELVLVVRPGQDDDIPDLGIALNMHIVEDTAPFRGPLAAIHAGLNASATPLSFVTAGDHPFLSKNLVLAMAAAALTPPTEIAPPHRLAEMGPSPDSIETPAPKSPRHARALNEPDSPTAVIPRTEGVLHPLHSIYPREQWTPYIAHALSNGDTSPRWLIENAITTDYPPVTIFTDEDLERTDPRKISLLDIDTPESLNRARQISEARKFTPRHHSLG